MRTSFPIMPTNTICYSADAKIFGSTGPPTGSQTMTITGTGVPGYGVDLPSGGLPQRFAIQPGSAPVEAGEFVGLQVHQDPQGRQVVDATILADAITSLEHKVRFLQENNQSVDFNALASLIAQRLKRTCGRGRGGTPTHAGRGHGTGRGRHTYTYGYGSDGEKDVKDFLKSVFPAQSKDF